MELPRSSEDVMDYLKGMANYMKPKPSYYITVSGKNSTIQTTFTPPLTFPEDCQYEMACSGVETYYSFPNIDGKNNKLQISLDKGKTWIQLELVTGCYEIEAINTSLKKLIKEKGASKDVELCLAPNKNTLQSILTLKNVWISFSDGEKGSLRTVLGFDAKVYKDGIHESEHTVNILRVNSIIIHCDIITLSRKNGIASPIIYSFFPNVSPGQKIVDRPKNLIYLPLTLSVISQMTVWLTDQNDEPLDIRGEELTITFHIRAC